MKKYSARRRILIFGLAVFFFGAYSALILTDFPIPGQNIAFGGEHGGGDHGDHGDDGGHESSSGDNSSADSADGGDSGGSEGSGHDGSESDSGASEGGDHDGGGDDVGDSDDGHDGGEGDHDDLDGDLDDLDHDGDQHDSHAAPDNHVTRDSQHDDDSLDQIFDLHIFSQIDTFIQSLFASTGTETDGDHEPEVLLAINADKETLSKAMDSGLIIDKQLDLPQLGLTITKLRVPAGENENEFRDRLRAEGHKGIMLNHYYRLDGSSQKSRVRELYPGAIIGWPAAMSCGLGMKIGMIDGRVNAKIPLLRRQRIVRRSFVNGDISTGSEHGTAMASILVGCHHRDFCGLLPEAILFSATAFSAHKSKDPRATALAVARSLDWLIGEKVEAINLSFSGPDNDLLRQAVAATLARHIPVIAAAGNHGKVGTIAYPAAYPGVIAVTAVDRFKRLYHRANQGKYISFAAPGVRIPVPDANGGISYKTGTSFAAAYCTALVARFQKDLQKIKTTHTAVEHLKKNVVDLGAPGKDPLFGWGLVQCARGYKPGKR